MKAYELRHVVGFEETNLVGNVYFVNHLRWQGRCREMFLRDEAPDVLAALDDGLALVTTRASCRYLSELRAHDEVVVRMTLGRVSGSRLTMRFDFVARRDGGESLVARGEQEIACMRRSGDELRPAPLPASLRAALHRYSRDAGAPAVEAGRRDGHDHHQRA